MGRRYHDDLWTPPVRTRSTWYPGKGGTGSTTTPWSETNISGTSKTSRERTVPLKEKFPMSSRRKGQRMSGRSSDDSKDKTSVPLV